MEPPRSSISSTVADGPLLSWKLGMCWGSLGIPICSYDICLVPWLQRCCSWSSIDWWVSRHFFAGSSKFVSNTAAQTLQGSSLQQRSIHCQTPLPALWQQHLDETAAEVADGHERFGSTQGTQEIHENSARTWLVWLLIMLTKRYWLVILNDLNGCFWNYRSRKIKRPGWRWSPW